MKKLVNDLVEKGYLRTEVIQDAFFRINRCDFVSDELEKEAEKNIPLPIGFGKQIIQPQKAAFILENLDLNEKQKVLLIGSDSGWVANLIAEIIGQEGKVIVIDGFDKLTELAQENSRKYNFLKAGRIEFVVGEESKGFQLNAPYDRIISLVSFSDISEELKKQLKIGGKMLVPIKGHYTLLERKTFDYFTEDAEVYLKELKVQASQKIYSFIPNKK